MSFYRLIQSLSSALREIIFGVEDGLISVFGLVIGMAAGAESSVTVLLAGATGAVASAVSMSAGTYLSVKSERDLAEMRIADEAEEIRRDPQAEEREIIDFLRPRGFGDEEIAILLRGARRSPDLLLEFMTAYELQIGRAERADPIHRAVWMFVADLLAALFPVVPFALLPLSQAVLVSIAATTLALIALGVGRGLATRGNVLIATLETLGIAAVAAVAGYAIARLISGLAGVQVPVAGA